MTFIATRIRRNTLCFAALFSVLVVSSAQSKTTVKTAENLPRFAYPMTLAPSVLVTSSDDEFARFATPVRADLEKTLAQYDIQDHATLREMLKTELDFQLLSGREDAAALETVHRLRALEDKPDARLTTGLQAEALLQVRLSHGQLPKDFAGRYGELLAPLPSSMVINVLKQAKRGSEIRSAALIIGGLQTDQDPVAAKSHMISNVLAWKVIDARASLKLLLPLQPAAHDVLAAYIAKNDQPLPDIWAARDVTFHDADKLTPVNIGIWDSGVDTALFPHNLYTDPNPGKTDPHGLAFNLDGYSTHGDLFPLPPNIRAGYNQEIDLIKGLSDLEANLDSPEATQVLTRVKSLKPSQVPEFWQTLEQDGIFAHGTPVAGIAVRGNPAARIAVARMEFDWKNIPTAPTEARVRRDAANHQTYVDYFVKHGIRVVNMSWVGDAAGYEVALEKNGIGKTVEERKKLARHYFEIDKAGLYAALKSAPDILFICAAGNSDSSADFDEDIPASLKLPNLLTVGAVDQAGQEASFTSYGDTVLVDADGYHVLSYVPGGRQIQLSGTSMASPNVTNLAAKLLALDPRLTPVETIELIRSGATVSTDGRRHLIDPATSVALLKKRLGAVQSASN